MGPRATLEQLYAELQARFTALRQSLASASKQVERGDFPHRTLRDELSQLESHIDRFSSAAEQLLITPFTLPVQSLEQAASLVLLLAENTLQELKEILAEAKRLTIIPDEQDALLEPVRELVRTLSGIGGNITPAEEDAFARLRILLVAAKETSKSSSDVAIEIAATWGAPLGRAADRGWIRLMPNDDEARPSQGPQASSSQKSDDPARPQTTYLTSTAPLWRSNQSLLATSETSDTKASRNAASPGTLAPSLTGPSTPPNTTRELGRRPSATLSSTHIAAQSVTRIEDESRPDSHIPESAPDESSQAAAPELTVESFSQFRDRNRLHCQQQLEAAPWTRSDYPDKLARRFEQLLGTLTPSFGELWLLAAGARELPLSLPSPDDIEILAHLWAGTTPLQRRTEAELSDFSEAYEDSNPQGSRIKWKLAITLKALVVSPEETLPLHDIAPLLKHLDFRSTFLHNALAEMLHLSARGEDALDLLRIILGSSVASGESAEKLEQKRAALRDRFHMAQRRKVFFFETNFCQELWVKYISKVHPTFARLFPGTSLPPPDEIIRSVPVLLNEYAIVMDRAGARHQDRRHMDRTFGDLLTMMREIAGLAKHAERDTRTFDAPRRSGLSKDLFARIANEPAPAGPPEEAFIWRLLGNTLRVAPPSHEALDPLSLSTEALCRLPPLLAYVRTWPKDLAQQLSYKDLLHPREACSWILSGHPEENYTATAPTLIDIVRQPCWAHLAPKLVGSVHENERARILGEEATRRARTIDLHSIASAKAEQLGAALHPIATTLKSALLTFTLLLDESSQASDLDGLAQAWMTELNTLADKSLTYSIDGLSREALHAEDGVRSLAQQFIAERRFAEAIALLRGGETTTQGLSRATPFRWSASKLYNSPLERIEQLEDQQLSARWLGGLGDHNQQRSLRVHFAKLVLGPLYNRADKQANQLVVRTEELRAEIGRLGLNPSYVPQLSLLSALVFPQLGSALNSAKFVQAAAETVSTSAGGDHTALVVLLLPKVSKERRSQLLAEFRKRRLRAAVIDDLDLCRLLRPGEARGNLLLGLLEIILEQQPWRMFSPFQLVEGQHVQMEMYVGRREEAQQLANESRFTRLFSGRKLGKSALLRYVETTYDGHILPSGRTLRVLYVSAVGIDRDGALADTIIDALQKRFKVPVHTPRSEHTPYERLREAFHAFRAQNKNASILVVLDEADMFVEAELEEYQQRHEKCLSFLLRSRLDERDSQNLPFVRFLFTGYRVTNTREGAWANWGDILRLTPLNTDVAAQLIEGPLARLGIDASEQAAVIAYRCGYQPAVLLRFGERLLSLLDKRFPADVRDRMRIEVNSADVAQIADDEEVVQEIRTVVKNNFYGNDLGRVIYGALIGEFLSRGATSRLEHPEEFVVAHLKELSPNDDSSLNWLMLSGGSPHDEVRRQIDDLVERQLLAKIQRPGYPPEYGLRFPHHLAILAPLAKKDGLLDEISRLTAVRSGGARSSALRGLLHRGELAQLTRILTEPQDEVRIVPVFIWPSQLSGTVTETLFRRGVFDQLGLRTRAINWHFGNQKVAPESSVALVDASPRQLDELLRSSAKLPSTFMLAGGMELARNILENPERSLGGGGCVLLDPHWIGRLSLPLLSWWFKLGRGYEFSSSALQLIAAETRGIPALVIWLDRQLHQRDPEGGGLDLSDEQVADNIDAMRRAIASGEIGPSLEGLSKRERELMKMTRHAVEQFGELSGEDLEAALSDQSVVDANVPLGEGSEQKGYSAFSLAAPQDSAALRNLVIAGLLPALSGTEGRRLAVGTVSKDDPVFRVI